MHNTPDILKKILDRKAEEVAACKRNVVLDVVKQQAADASPVRGFKAALQEKMHAGLAAVIMTAIGISEALATTGRVSDFWRAFFLHPVDWDVESESETHSQE